VRLRQQRGQLLGVRGRVSISGPAAPNAIRFETSTTDLAGAARDLGGDVRRARERACEDDDPAVSAASAFVAATRERVSERDGARVLGSRDVIVTECPARVKAVASERPTCRHR
jgi:hypothetical protein